MTELEFIETYAPALTWEVDHLYLPMDMAAGKIRLARAMYEVRSDFTVLLTEKALEWVDQTAALTPMGRDDLAQEARARYEMARQCWSEIFAMKLRTK